MLVNNPMGSRRRRRFYHRAGVVPVPGERYKDDLSDFTFFRYDPEPQAEEVNDHSDDGENQPSPRLTQGGKRRVNYITVTSLHSRLLEIVDSMIALAEAEDRENEKLNGTNKATNADIGEPSTKTVNQSATKATDEAALVDEQTSAQTIEQATAEEPKNTEDNVKKSLD